MMYLYSNSKDVGEDGDESIYAVNRKNIRWKKRFRFSDRSPWVGCWLVVSQGR